MNTKVSKTQIAEWLSLLEPAQAEESKESFEERVHAVAGMLTAQAAAYIEAEIQRQGITAMALADRMGESRQRVSKVLRERGNITLHTLAKFAVALEARVGIEFGRQNETAAVEKTRYVILRDIAPEELPSEQACSMDPRTQRQLAYSKDIADTSTVVVLDNTRDGLVA